MTESKPFLSEAKKYCFHYYMLLIFDTNGGLCNQMFDIINGINFCVKNNLYFTFRHCSFRNENLTTWNEIPFEELFDLNFLSKYKLYVDYYNIKDKITNDNCYNMNDRLLSHIVFKEDNILKQLVGLNKDYIVLKQFWSLYKFKEFVDHTIHTHLRPSKCLMDRYIEIKNNIVRDEPYNFIHYRYEKDFTDYFKIDIDSLDNLIENTKFANNHLKVYIATSNIHTLIDLDNGKYKKILFKNNDGLNYEQQAFIDYMFGLNAVECYGHSKSSFSVMINNIKGTNNYYA